MPFQGVDDRWGIVMKGRQRRLWLAAGAMSIGVGAAVTGGTAFAHADTGESPSASDSAKPRVSSGTAHQGTAHHQQPQRAVAVRRAAAASKPAKTVLPINLSLIENALLGAAKPEQVGHSPRVRAAAASEPTAAALTSASAVPTLPSVGAIIPRLFNVLVPLINNTPIRDLLNLFDPPGTRGATVIRLAGVPSHAVLSPTGNVLFELTVPPSPLGSYFYVPPAYSTLTEISTSTNTVIGVPVNIRGVPVGAPVISADGTRAYQSSSVGTNVTYVTVIDTANSTVVGKPIRLDGWAAGGVVLSADGRHAYQATYAAVGGVFTTTVTAIDTTTVDTVGAPVPIQGLIQGSMVRNLDASRLCVSTTAEVAVIDTADMSLVGPPIAIDGSPNGGVVASPDGTRAVLTTDIGTFPDNTVKVTVIDFANGTVIGTPVILKGFTYSTVAAVPIFSDGGARINQITEVYDPNSKTTSTVLTVFDSATGLIVGTPIALPANDTHFMAVLAPDPIGSHLFVASMATAINSTIITVVDTADATVVGIPVTVSFYGTLVAGPDAESVYLSAALNYPPSATLVSVVNSDSVKTGTSANLNGPPVALLVNHGGARLYQLTDRGSYDEITALDAGTAGGPVSPVRVEGTLSSALITPDGGTIYATNNGSSPLLSLSFPYRVTVVKTSAIT